MRIVLASKIYNIKVEDKVLTCNGSIGIPEKLMKLAHIFPYEQVHVLDVNNGERFITYAISDSYLRVYGAASRKVEVGDKLIILTYQICGAPTEPTNPIFVDAMVEYDNPKMSIFEWIRTRF